MTAVVAAMPKPIQPTAAELHTLIRQGGADLQYCDSCGFRKATLRENVVRLLELIEALPDDPVEPGNGSNVPVTPAKST